MARSKGTVCGVPVMLTNRNYYGGGRIAPGARRLGEFAQVSKASAKKLVTQLGVRMPRPGYEVNLCASTWLSNASNVKFEVVRRDGQPLSGARRRKQRRR